MRRVAHALSTVLDDALDSVSLHDPDGEELVDDLDLLASAHVMRELEAGTAMLRVPAGRTEALEAARRPRHRPGGDDG